MLITGEVCQWTVCTPKGWASILLDISTSRNAAIIYLLTPRANKQQQVVEILSLTDVVQICMSTSITMISTVKDFQTTSGLVCTALCTLPYQNVSSWLVGNDTDTGVLTAFQCKLKTFCLFHDKCPNNYIKRLLGGVECYLILFNK